MGCFPAGGKLNGMITQTGWRRTFEMVLAASGTVSLLANKDHAIGHSSVYCRAVRKVPAPDGLTIRTLPELAVGAAAMPTRMWSEAARPCRAALAGGSRDEALLKMESTPVRSSLGATVGGPLDAHHPQPMRKDAQPSQRRDSDQVCCVVVATVATCCFQQENGTR